MVLANMTFEIWRNARSKVREEVLGEEKRQNWTRRRAVEANAGKTDVERKGTDKKLGFPFCQCFLLYE